MTHHTPLLIIMSHTKNVGTCNRWENKFYLSSVIVETHFSKLEVASDVSTTTEALNLTVWLAVWFIISIWTAGFNLVCSRLISTLKLDFFEFRQRIRRFRRRCWFHRVRRRRVRRLTRISRRRRWHRLSVIDHCRHLRLGAHHRRPCRCHLCILSLCQSIRDMMSCYDVYDVYDVCFNSGSCLIFHILRQNCLR